MANDFSTLINEPQSYFQNGGTSAQDYSAQVQGELKLVTKEGFPTPQGALEQLSDFINSIISAVISAIEAVWNAIVSFVGAVVNFIMAVWNNIIGPALGAVIELVKSVVTVLFNQIVNTIKQPMLSGQSTALSSLFGGESPDLIASSGMSVIPNLGSMLNSQSSVLSTVGSSIQTLMSAGSVFTGAGTILAPLIAITGPGIMSTLFDLIGNTILNTFITPLISQFTDSILGNALDSLTSSLGGINNALLQGINLIGNASSITDQSGVTSQRYGTASMTESTGSSDPTGGTGFTTDGLPTSTTSGSQPMSSDAFLNWLIQAGNFVNKLFLTILDDTTGLFSPLVTVFGTVLNGLEQLNTGTVDMHYLSIGLLGTFVDLLSAAKTYFPNNPQMQTLIQLCKLVLDAFQTEISLQVLFTKYTADLLEDTILSVTWALKSVTSGIADMFSFINDLTHINTDFKIEVKYLLDYYLPTWIWNIVKDDVGKFTHLAQAVLEIGTIVGVALEYFDAVLNGDLTIAQFAATTVFFIAIVGEIALKFIINIGKFKNPENESLEQNEKYLSLAEAGTEVGEMVFTFIGLLAE